MKLQQEMSPPPVTPSPHRFIVKKQAPRPHKTPLVQQTPQRPSTQRVNATPRASQFNVAAPRPSQLNATQPQHPRSSTPQFNATPRFNFSSTPRPTASPNPPVSTPASTRFVTPAKPISKLEDVVDCSPDDPSQDIYESIETATQSECLEYDSADDDGFEIGARSPKRRRLTSSPLPTEVVNNEEYDDGLETSPLPILSSPQASRRQITTTAPRFLISTPLPLSTPQQDSAQPTFLKPPRFRPPDPSSQSQTTDPLPEQFSPHRRGQKYLPGGLAAEVRDWLMNIESTVSAADGQKKRVDQWSVKLVVDEVSGGTRAGMTLVRGRQLHAGDDGAWILDNLGVTRIALAGEEAGTGLQKGKKAELGKLVGIKGPLWEIMIEGERWGIGVDWKVLDDL